MKPLYYGIWFLDWIYINYNRTITSTTAIIIWPIVSYLLHDMHVFCCCYMYIIASDGVSWATFIQDTEMWGRHRSQYLSISNYKDG